MSGLSGFGALGEKTPAQLRGRIRNLKTKLAQARAQCAGAGNQGSCCGCSSCTNPTQATEEEKYGPFTLFQWAVIGGVTLLFLKKK